MSPTESDGGMNGKAIKGLFGNRWVVGGAVSFAFIWMVSALFCNSVEPYSYDAATRSWITAPGTTVFYRSEGWGRSYVGELGIGFIPHVSEETSRVVLFWGDSYVEAFQVDDADKVAQQLTTLFHAHGQNRICAGRGMSGDNLADYIVNISQYERQIPSVDHHIVFISSSEDILPDQAEDTRTVFRSTNGGELRRTDPQYHLQDVKYFVNRSRLYFTWPLVKSVMQRRSLRFSLGPIRASSDVEGGSRTTDPSELCLKRMWDFLSKSMREATSHGVTVVYVPHVPRIAGNQVVCDDLDWPLVSDFAESCRSQNIGFVNMAGIFIRHYRATGEFPRGFPNSRPGDGHLNAVGHRLVAQALFEYLDRTGL